MPKKWTLKEDRFLVEHWNNIGPMIARHDLGRSEKAAKARVEHLKQTGAWILLERMYESEYVYLRQYYEAVGTEDDIEMLDGLHHGATLIRPGFWDDAAVSKPPHSHLKVVK